MKEARDFYVNNRKKLRELVAKEGVNLLLITGNSFVQSSADRTYPFEQDGNIFYLTGIEEPGALLVIDGDKEYLAVPSRSENRVAFEGSVNTEKLSEIAGINNIFNEEEAWPKIENALKKQEKVGVLMPPETYIAAAGMLANPARQHLVNRLKDLQSGVGLFDLRKALSGMRTVKSEYEVGMIKEAVEHTENLFEDVIKAAGGAHNETELLALASDYSVRNRLPFAYEPIVAGGANACTLHYIENNADLKKDDLLLLDIGLKYNGYSADITRTLSNGTPSTRQKEVYAAVLSVQEFALGILKPGIIFKDYEAEVLEKMGIELQKLKLIKGDSKEEIRKYYPHSSSHFLGIDVHDPCDYQRPLEPGMVLTVEPGIYIKEESIGIRIEDDVLITKDGNEVLTSRLPKALSSLTIKT